MEFIRICSHSVPFWNRWAADCPYMLLSGMLRGALLSERGFLGFHLCLPNQLVCTDIPGSLETLDFSSQTCSSCRLLEVQASVRPRPSSLSVCLPPDSHCTKQIRPRPLTLCS